MIEIRIKADQEQIAHEMATDKVKAGEVANIVYSLEKIKKELLEIEFDGYEITTTDEDESEE